MTLYRVEKPREENVYTDDLGTAVDLLVEVFVNPKSESNISYIKEIHLYPAKGVTNIVTIDTYRWLKTINIYTIADPDSHIEITREETIKGIIDSRVLDINGLEVEVTEPLFREVIISDVRRILRVKLGLEKEVTDEM